MTGTTGCVFVDDVKWRYPNPGAGSVDDLKHPPLPEKDPKRLHPPGVRVQCRHAGINGHPANVYFRDAHPHFDIDGCNGCKEFADCGKAEGKLPG